MKHLFTLLVVAIVLFSCVLDPLFDEPGSATTCDGALRSVHVSFIADTAFTPDERAELSLAAKQWNEFSGGRMAFELAYGGVGDAHVWRSESWMQSVKDYEASQHEGPDYQVVGYTLNSRDVYLVVDRFPSGQLHQVAEHEWGHVAGFEWPNCDVLFHRNACHHSPNINAVMYPHFGGQQLSAGDKQFCRASCLCD